jgi:predicted nuclease of predicted toxin-antitoxin system
MKFICDVHISYKLVKFLTTNGFDALHVNVLENKWHTKDNEICRFADANNLIVITKDEDFRNSFFLHRSPRKLVRILLGNISNTNLLFLFEKHLPLIENLNKNDRFYLELGSTITVYTFQE